MRRHTRAPEALAAPVLARSRRGLALLTGALALLVGALPGCAKKGPPSGGPPDLEPPRMVETSPDSGAAGVSRHPRISVTFSEGMEPHASAEAVELAPPVAIKQRRWSGRTLSLELQDSLRADHTYTLFVGSGARDLHGNNLQEQRTIVFTTAAEFPPGGIEGHVEAVGFKAPGTTLWCYRDGRKPDSTARDFDALGVADAAGRFRIRGLSVPGTWRLWGFADLNGNRSFEPDADLLVPSDTTFELTAEHPVVTEVRLHMLNPRAPGKIAGTVTDTLSGLAAGLVRIYAVGVADTTRHLLYEVPENGAFDFEIEAGAYRLRAFKDLDHNRAWKRDVEPASEEQVVELKPGGEVNGLVFVLQRPPKPQAAP
jgi:hypothetical protein